MLILAGCGEGVPAIDTEPTEHALTELADAAGFPASSTFVVLDDCPIADGQLLLERALTDIDTPFTQLALEADPIAFLSAPNEDPDGDPYIACGRLAPDSVGVALAIADAPGDGVDGDDVDDDGEPLGEQEIDDRRDDLAQRYGQRFGDPPDNVTVERRQNTRGGAFFDVCISEPALPERDACEVAWFGGDLVVSVLITGPGSLDTDLDAIRERTRPLLQLITDGLAEDG